MIISTHAPLAGRDLTILMMLFCILISTHAPLAGRDQGYTTPTSDSMIFQPTRPLRGATRSHRCHTNPRGDFNPRAPCGARPLKLYISPAIRQFQPTRPLRGATTRLPGHTIMFLYFNPRAPCGARRSLGWVSLLIFIFQPTRPLRGATIRRKTAPKQRRISTHAPLAGRDVLTSVMATYRSTFQPTRPLRGATST